MGLDGRVGALGLLAWTRPTYPLRRVLPGEGSRSEGCCRPQAPP